MFRCCFTIIRERIHSCLVKLQLLKQTIKIHRCVDNAVVVWHTCICSHTTIVLSTHFNGLF